ncbi:MAG: ABC transporter substrate-binding protein [Clostridia bacterium]|nr:ABC transporter substrate-binding protein [Clostridia bacterium]
MNKRTILTLTLALLLLLLPLTACSGGGDEGGEEGALRDVTVILDYIANTNHTGMYVAQKLGYYEEEGLSVTITEPADGVTPTLIAAGKGDFGVSYQEDLTYARASEDPLPIKAIATLIQHNTSGIASLQSKGIETVADFAGKTYAGWGSPAEEAILKAVMASAGLDPAQLKIITSDSVSYFGLESEYDLIWLFEAWDAIAASRDGLALNYIALRDLDTRLDYYTPILLTSESMLENDPELVRAFLRATRKGYEYAMQNPEEAAGILHETASTYDLEMLIESQNYLTDKYVEDAPRWGEMKAEVWSGYTDFMLEHQLIDRAVPAEECFTNEFLPE